jgi:predicted phosphodiesterase
MKVALLSDIHGNSVALEAVLADVEAHGGVDAYWILGDLVALGPEPIRVLERLRSLPNVRFVRGNTDRYVALGDRPGPSIEEASSNPGLLPALVEIANTFAWTQGVLSAHGCLDWLRDLPSELSLTLPDGTRFLGVHASPGRDDGPGIRPETEDAAITRLLGACNASLVCVGHTHHPSDRRINGVQIVNLGAVSLSLTGDKDSSYVLMDAVQDHYWVRHRRVPYNRQAVIDQLNRIRHPGRAHIIKQLVTPA